MLNIGDINQLDVKRKTDIGYMLTDGKEDVFLHFNETNHKELKDGETVDAFLYFDNKARLAATLSTPVITVKQKGFVMVKEINHDLGVFVDNGISKDMLVSKDFLPYDFDKWPVKGDMLYCILRHKNRLTAKPLNKYDVDVNTEEKLSATDRIDAYVIHVGNEGYNLLSIRNHLIFVHQTQVREALRMGQKVNVRIQRVNPFDYNGSLIETKEKVMDQDAEVIFKYIKANKKIRFNSDSDPKEILETFGMSKKAFKRALGRLYSERKIMFEGDYTVLVEGDE